MAKTDLQKIGITIKTEREKQKMTKSKLSIITFGDVNSTSKILDIEKGSREKISYLTIIKLLKTLGIKNIEL